MRYAEAHEQYFRYAKLKRLCSMLDGGAVGHHAAGGATEHAFRVEQAVSPDSSMKVSILDQSPISEGFTGADALRNTLDLARLADSLGYARCWVAEHHGTPMLACASPEVMIAAIGSMTSRLRIGSGGVMLPHYSPLKVAETFSILSALFPDRVDLGIGRAPGTDHATAYALQRDRRQAAPDDFPQQLGELLGYLENNLPPSHPFARLAALPGRPHVPDLW